MEKSLNTCASICGSFVLPRSKQSTLKNTDMVLALSSLSFGCKCALAIGSDVQEEEERKGN